MNTKKLIFAIIGFVAVIGLGGCATKQNQTALNNSIEGPVVTDAKWVGLAKALTTAGAKFYGAYWCSHCNEQKELFGDAVQYAPYVECAPNKNDPYEQSSACKVAKIEGYPTWVFADGSRVESVMSFEALARKIGYQAT